MPFIINKISFDKIKDNQAFEFETESLKSDIIFSIVIGPNGTGKSLFLKKIIQIFREIESLKHTQNNRYESLSYYFIDYTLGQNRYKIEKNGKEFNFKRNNKIKTINEIVLPNTILALSSLQEDKFIFQSIEENKKSFYKYLGARNTANAVFVGAINKKIREILFDNIHDTNFVHKMAGTFDLLGYEAKIKINFKYKAKSIVSTKITRKTIQQKMKTINKNSKYKRIELSEQEENELVKYIHEKRIEAKINKDKHYMSIVFDFGSIKPFDDEYSIVRNMIALDLIAQSNIELFNKETGIDSEYLSSGEKNLLFVTLNILANIKDESILLIDEPEISLHPNWQLKYNLHLKKILAGYKNIHIFIATHSHFMVSGLKSNESNIFSININKGVECIAEDIYSWSAENILYRIFQTRTVNNYYLHKKLTEIFKLISEDNHNNLRKIKEGYVELKQVVFHKDDPLSDLLQRIEKYLDAKA